jgi:DNA-binding transcriptional ArsR family regulator
MPISSPEEPDNSMNMEPLFEEVSHYFALLSQPTRLKILYAVCNGERSVNDIVVQVESTQANVSRQINMLYRAKILSRRKDGAQVYYRVADHGTIELCRSVCGRVAARLGREMPGAAIRA